MPTAWPMQNTIFPPEVWTTITSFLDAREVGRLYLGSNHAIRGLLHIAVTHLADWSDSTHSTKLHYYSPLRAISSNFVRRFVYLTYLHLPYNTNLNDSDMASLPKHVKHIDLSCNEQLTNGGISNLPTYLETLNLKFATSITDSAISYLPRTLRHLDLDRCRLITDDGIRNLPPRLESLSLTFARNISDRGVQFLPKTLIRLQLAMNKAITPHGVRQLPAGLEILDLSHNTNLSGTNRQDFPPQLKLLLLL